MNLIAQAALSPTHESYRIIPLNKGQVAFVSECDYLRVAMYIWKAIFIKDVKSYYAYAVIDGKTTYMHRFILGARRGQFVDHREIEATLDNRRENLRFCTRSQNQYNRRRQSNNTSGYRGVCLFKLTGKWMVYINANGKRIHLGYVDTKEQGRDLRNAAALRLHGEFARLD